ncbi:cupin domain-containing protein [Variovorax paradoxus]|nr:cupin domain-containing protein [Variovorax paradoxus]MBT2304667.1 cupin domain-containing protein [Variovorax paradoxus]
MKRITASLAAVSLIGAAVAQTSPAPATGSAPAASSVAPQGMSISRNGTRPSAPGPAQFFAGTARIDPLFPVNAPSRMSGASVTFEPGARSNWHTHPLGQVLVVTAGFGLAQQWGKAIQELRPGDVLWCPPGVKHWHGASPTTSLTHMALQESLDGKNVEWLEAVTDQQYSGR